MSRVGQSSRALCPFFHISLKKHYTKMAAMNDNVYARVRDKMREQNFSEQEIEALDNARGLLKTYGKCHLNYARAV
jgi:hypothetical protein